MFRFCVQILCSDFVFRFCIQILCSDFVFRFCVQILCWRKIWKMCWYPQVYNYSGPLTRSQAVANNCNNHLGLTFWVVAYGRLDCSIFKTSQSVLLHHTIFSMQNCLLSVSIQVHTVMYSAPVLVGLSNF